MKSKSTLFYYIVIFSIQSAALIATTLISLRAIRNSIYSETTSQLITTARLAANSFRYSSMEESDIQAFVSAAVEGTSLRMTVVFPDGRVAGDSHFEKDLMENHGGRPEIISGLSGGEGAALRYSDTLKQFMAYAAVPAEGKNGYRAVLRVSLPLEEIKKIFTAVLTRITAAGAVMLVFALLGGLFAARKVVNPIQDLKKAAERYAEGDFTHPLSVERPAELKLLGGTLSGMALQLKSRMSMMTRQNAELTRVLTGMAEPVILLDRDMRILKLNRAAEELIRFQQETPDRSSGGSAEPSPEGRALLEVLRNTSLYNFAQSLLARSSGARSSGAGEDSADTETHRQIEITLYRYRRNRPVVSPGEDPGILYIQVNGSRIEAEQNSGGHQVLLVMNDITRLKRLESIRRDFVANVSHELKSPITSIQGFVETLESGALRDPEKAGRFLGIIAKQAARLNSITDDLLSLSRVEQTGTEGIAFARTRLTDVVSHAVSEYASKAEKLSIALLVSVPEDLEADLNAPLMEQALMNLIDNALKYGRGGLEVRISAGAEDSAGNKDAAAGGKEIRISVRDFGEGIPKASLPRIFERFYTVDKSRSKELGGTGLGLALVKHIMIAHGGSVSVESEQGAGSTFTLHLPAGRKDA